MLIRLALLPRGRRVACDGMTGQCGGDCGSCHFGCPTGAKRTTPRTFLKDATDRGARVLVRAQVERMAIGEIAHQAFNGWLRRKRQVGVSVDGDTLQPGNP